MGMQVPLFALCILSMSVHCIYHPYAGGIQVNVVFGLDILACVEWLKNAIYQECQNQGPGTRCGPRGA